MLAQSNVQAFMRPTGVTTFSTQATWPFQRQETQERKGFCCETFAETRCGKLTFKVPVNNLNVMTVILSQVEPGLALFNILMENFRTREVKWLV